MAAASRGWPFRLNLTVEVAMKVLHIRWKGTKRCPFSEYKISAYLSKRYFYPVSHSLHYHRMGAEVDDIWSLMVFDSTE